MKPPISWSVWPAELSVGDIPTFGLNGMCHPKGYDFRVLCLNWNTIFTSQCFEQKMVYVGNPWSGFIVLTIIVIVLKSSSNKSNPKPILSCVKRETRQIKTHQARYTVDSR